MYLWSNLGITPRTMKHDFFVLFPIIEFLIFLGEGEDMGREGEEDGQSEKDGGMVRWREGGREGEEE